MLSDKAIKSALHTRLAKALIQSNYSGMEHFKVGITLFKLNCYLPFIVTPYQCSYPEVLTLPNTHTCVYIYISHRLC